jgi:DNA-binding NarL/FixJ family response regulator
VTVATDISIERWTRTRPSPSVTLAVLAQGEAKVREITEALARDGLLVTLAFAGFTDMGLDMLSPQPDVIVVDASADAFDAEGATRRSRAALRDAGIVVICPQGAERAVRRYLQAGADGVVFRDELETNLPSVVRCACAGQISVPRTALNVVSPPALSYREKEVLQLAAGGLTNSQIASRLFLAESTVKTHLSSVFRRLGVSSRREAAALMRSADNDTRRQLLPAPPRPVPGSAALAGGAGLGA